MAETSTLKLLFSKSPLSAKWRFKLRNMNNVLFGILIFVPVAVVFSFAFRSRMSYAWLADAILIVILYYFFVMFLDKRPIWIRCPHCRKKIGTNTPWICGACGGKNEHVNDFTFLNKCESCGVEPKAYQCHHHKKDDELCGKLIFLTEDELMHNYAVCLNRTEKEIEQTTFETSDRRLNYRLHLAELTTKVKKAEKEMAAVDKKDPKDMTPEEKVKDHYGRRKAKTVTAAMLYRDELKVINAESDPLVREKLMKALTDWYEGGDWERII